MKFSMKMQLLMPLFVYPNYFLTEISKSIKKTKTTNESKKEGSDFIK